MKQCGFKIVNRDSSVMKSIDSISPTVEKGRDHFHTPEKHLHYMTKLVLICVVPSWYIMYDMYTA